MRTVGDEHKPQTFRTWAPKAIALIGTLPDTLHDRSIEVPLRRKLKGEKVARLRGDRSSDQTSLLRKCLRWALDNIDALKDADPDVPGALNDRQADNWRPLLAVADQIGRIWLAAWPSRCAPIRKRRSRRRASCSFRTSKSCFPETGKDRLQTASLLEKLHEMDDPAVAWMAPGQPRSLRTGSPGC